MQNYHERTLKNESKKKKKKKPFKSDNTLS